MFGIKQISLTHSGDWVKRIRDSGNAKTCNHTRYYTQAKEYLTQRHAQWDLEKAGLLNTHSVEVIPETMYEGFTNYSTWLAATCCDNHQPLYQYVHQGLEVVAKRFKLGDPNASSYPWTTTAQQSPDWMPRLKKFIITPKAIDVSDEMTAYVSTTFVYNQILPYVNEHCSNPDGEYPEFSAIKVCTEQLSDHLLGMYFDKVYQENHYVRENKHEY